MKYFLLGVTLLFLSECKIKKAANHNEESQPTVQQSNLNPDECLVTASLVSSDDHSSQIVLKEIHEKGFAFKQNVIVGDTLSVEKTTLLKNQVPQKVILRFSMRMGGGTYSVKNPK